eukprot:m51a1_g12319 putative pantoate-beta-alanine ligase (283) ;mRNA; f:417900-419055
MQVVSTVEELKAARAKLPLGATVGFVPTMGYLHAGHISLVKRAKQENQFAIVSIFVNPTQFGPNEDLDKYPRNLENDLRLLREVGCDIVFTPTPASMYQSGHRTWVTVDVDSSVESQRRPIHFRGVATVVLKLFNLAQPRRCYFGQKDAVQCVVIRRMVSELNVPTEIVVCPTVREESDGLALSSRNTYLTPEQRSFATVLRRGLLAAEARIAAGSRRRSEIVGAAESVVAAEQRARLDYISLASNETAVEADEAVAPGEYILSGAVFIGSTRLIDNIIVRC